MTTEKVSELREADRFYVSGEWKKKLVYMVPHKTYEDAQYSVRGDNSEVLTLPDKAQILY